MPVRVEESVQWRADSCCVDNFDLPIGGSPGRQMTGVEMAKTTSKRTDPAPAASAGRDVLAPGTRVAVTGANGFIGSAITRALVARRLDVVALVEPGTRQTNLDGMPVERLEADVRDAEAMKQAIAGVRLVFHVAAVYRFWAPDPASFYRVNVDGTRNVLEAARAAGCELVVYTSSVGTLGLEHVAERGPADETCAPHVGHLFGLYKQSKYVAEHEVLRAAALGMPVILALPTTPLGPGDHTPTPTGRLVLDFLNGRMPGWFDTALNIVDVDDVAAGHLLAAERGGIGRSYIVGGENLELREILAELARCTGLPRPRFRVPRPVAFGAAYLSELVEGRLLNRTPHVPLEGARMASTRMVFSDARARRELGYRSRPAAEAIERSARWFAENGYVTDKRCAAIHWRPATA
ncbi:MAG: hopanoid-associated sugar epimerase [Acidimicrobiales bacterium]